MEVLDVTLAEIGRLERQYKLTGKKDVKWEMELKMNTFKIMDASQAAKEICMLGSIFLSIAINQISRLLVYWQMIKGSTR